MRIKHFIVYLMVLCLTASSIGVSLLQAGEAYGIIVANRDKASTWETFLIKDLGNHKVALYVGTGDTGEFYYLSAESGGGTLLRANRQELKEWETFTLEDLGNNKIALKAHNGQYVCAEPSGAVFANRNARGDWETFTKESLGTNTFPSHEGGVTGEAVHLKSSHGKYLCADYNHVGA